MDIRITGNTQPGIGGGRTFGSGGASFHPPAGAAARPGFNGGMTYSHAGMSYSTDRSGRLASISKPGMETRYGSNGTVRSAHFERPGGAQMNVSRGMHGERSIESVRADHTRVVSWAPHAGYVERPYRPGYVSRTYVYGERTYVHVYRTYYYQGVTYYGYVPPVYYGPRFYGWAWNPWPAPVVYGWAWNGSPWLGFYGGYFAPEPAYPTAALWLADYLLAEDLELAWENRQAALAGQQEAAQEDEPPPAMPAGSGGGVILTPEVKQAVAEEVKQEIAAEYAAAGQGGADAASPARAPAALDPNRRIFVVSTSLAVSAGGQDCGLTAGDIIARANDTMISARNTVSVRVLGSKPGDCPMNSIADVDLAALQEMRNQLQDQVGRGLKMLSEDQGKKGLPAGPPAEARQAPDGQAPPESAASVDSALTQQQQDANRALQEAQQAALGK
jgi:hypothetical protein